MQGGAVGLPPLKLPLTEPQGIITHSSNAGLQISARVFKLLSQPLFWQIPVFARGGRHNSGQDLNVCTKLSWTLGKHPKVKGQATNLAPFQFSHEGPPGSPHFRGSVHKGARDVTPPQYFPPCFSEENKSLNLSLFFTPFLPSPHLAPHTFCWWNPIHLSVTEECSII